MPRHATPVYVRLQEYFPSLLAVKEATRRAMIEDFLSGTKYTVDDGLQALEDHLTVASTPRDLRRQEYEALNGAPEDADLGPPAPNFEAVQGIVPELLLPLVARCVLVRRLREVSVLHGFSRLEGPDPEDPDAVAVAPITKTKPRWLPAREVFGEGLFFSIQEDALKKVGEQTSLVARIARIQRAYDGWRQVRKLTPIPGAVTTRRVLLHTLSHLLIRELSLSCGYGVSSLRERVYTDGEQRGVLIYTAASDSDGSLGGLVGMGRPERLEGVFESAFEAARWCSQDPLCGERQPDAGAHLSGAACHACLLLPETSCELGNRFLDRALVVPGDEAPSLLAFR